MRHVDLDERVGGRDAARSRRDGFLTRCQAAVVKVVSARVIGVDGVPRYYFEGAPPCLASGLVGHYAAVVPPAVPGIPAVVVQATRGKSAVVTRLRLPAQFGSRKTSTTAEGG